MFVKSSYALEYQQRSTIVYTPKLQHLPTPLGNDGYPPNQTLVNHTISRLLLRK